MSKNTVVDQQLVQRIRNLDGKVNELGRASQIGFSTFGGQVAAYDTFVVGQGGGIYADVHHPAITPDTIIIAVQALYYGASEPSYDTGIIRTFGQKAGYVQLRRSEDPNSNGLPGTNYGSWYWLGINKR